MTFDTNDFEVPNVKMSDLNLIHSGKLGMKWGVRRQRREARLRNVAKGKSGTSGKLTNLTGYVAGPTGPRLGPVDLIKGRGITGAAKRKSIRETSRTNRFKKGKATVGDHIVRYGLLHASDLIPVSKKNVKKRTVVDNRRIALAASGAVIAARFLLVL